MPKRLTLKQVAEVLQVSTATVSNAFNRPDQLSANLRESILKRCRELGYHGPSLAARSLRRGESNVIAVMLADSLSYNFSDPVANQFLQGVADILEVHNKQLLLLSSDADSLQQSSAESLPDGIIFYGTPHKEIFERILATGKPAIAVDFEQDRLASVNVDNFSAARQAAEHLFSQGIRHIAVMGLRLVESRRVCRLVEADLHAPSTEISSRRLQGYLAAAEAAGVSLSAEQIWHIPLNKEEVARQAIREALTSQPRPQALLCMSDVIALCAEQQARELGICVPDELRIVGFDDIPQASQAAVPLTTVCQQSREKGRLAAKRLLDGDLSGELLLETRLVVRGSSVQAGSSATSQSIS